MHPSPCMLCPPPGKVEPGARICPSGPEFTPPICVLPAGRNAGSESPSLELRSLLNRRAKPCPAFFSDRGGVGKCHRALYPFIAFILHSLIPQNVMEHLLDVRPCRHEGVREAPDAPPAHVQGQCAVSMQERAGAPTGVSTGLGGASKETRRIRWLHEGRESTWRRGVFRGE